ncbi:hypothetical protein [Sphingomonas sp. Leaf10]|uniref:hypothetical protein n=1 Tax=Sphingomonas sp. Leaf10 TaxID=1735676 RepID=UPI0012E1C1D3|nr:hypothetical protein [Sphingomonas sp. Leaf10]
MKLWSAAIGETTPLNMQARYRQLSNVPNTLSIDREFAKLNRLRFLPEIEARFDAEGVDHRKRVGRISLMAGIFIFNMFLFADLQIMPDISSR